MKKVTDIFGETAELAKSILKEKDGGGTHVSPNNDRWLRAIESGDEPPTFEPNHPLSDTYLCQWQQRNCRLIREYIERQMYRDNQVQPLTAWIAAWMPEISGYYGTIERWTGNEPDRDQLLRLYRRIDRAVYGGNVGEDSLVCAYLANWAIRQIATDYVAKMNETDF